MKYPRPTLTSLSRTNKSGEPIMKVPPTSGHLPQTSGFLPLTEKAEPLTDLFLPMTSRLVLQPSDAEPLTEL